MKELEDDIEFDRLGRVGVGAVSLSRVVFSKKSDHWETPGDLYDALDAEFKFTFDPCPLRGLDGLTCKWRGNIFINPPYSNIYEFIDKGLHEISMRRAKVCVFLLPSRTGTDWFHELILQQTAEIRFLRGRLKFGGSKNSAPFDSMIAVFRQARHV